MENQTKKKINPLVRIALAITALLILSLGGMAFSLSVDRAQTETPQQPAPPEQGFGRLPMFESFGRFGRDIDYDSLLANALGITVEKLQAAREEADKAALAEAVKKGYLSEEQAQLIEARQALAKYIDQDALLAKALNISVEELRTSLQEEKSLPALVDKLGLDMAKVQADLQTAYKDGVQQAVKDGVITQAQADQIISEGFGGRMFGGVGPGFGGPGKLPRGSDNCQPGTDNGQNNGT